MTESRLDKTRETSQEEGRGDAKLRMATESKETKIQTPLKTPICEINFTDLEQAAEHLEDKQTILRILTNIKQEISHIEKFFPVPNKQLYYPEIRDLLEAVSRQLEKIPSTSGLHHSIRQTIQKAIAPLQADVRQFLLQEEGVSDEELLLRTQALYAQQAFIMRETSFSKALRDTLTSIKQTLPEKSIGLRCFISYAWPMHHHQSKEEWLQPFLRGLHAHLAQAGIKPRLDIIDGKVGDNIVTFTQHIADSEFALLICTDSLWGKLHDQQFRMIQAELSSLRQKYDLDITTGQVKVFPLLVSGSRTSALLPEDHLYQTIQDWRNQGYLKNLEQLIAWICYPQGTSEAYQKIWQDFYTNYAVLANRMPKKQVEKELALQWHQRQMEMLKSEISYQYFIEQQKETVKLTASSDDTKTSHESKKYYAQLGDKILAFDEHRILGDGNCGFTSLGTTREEVSGLLLSLAGDEKARTELADEIQGLLRENRKSKLHTEETQKLFAELDNVQADLDEQIRQLNNQLATESKSTETKTTISASFQRQSLEGLIEKLKDSSHLSYQTALTALRAARLHIFQIGEKIKLCCQSRKVFEHYIVEGLARTEWLGYRSAKLFTKLKQYNFYVFHPAVNKPGWLELVEQQVCDAPKNTFYLFHTNSFTHYNLLSVASTPTLASTLPAEKSVPSSRELKIDFLALKRTVTEIKHGTIKEILAETIEVFERRISDYNIDSNNPLMTERFLLEEMVELENLTITTKEKIKNISSDTESGLHAHKVLNFLKEKCITHKEQLCSIPNFFHASSLFEAKRKSDPGLKINFELLKKTITEIRHPAVHSILTSTVRDVIRWDQYFNLTLEEEKSDHGLKNKLFQDIADLENIIKSHEAAIERTGADISSIRRAQTMLDHLKAACATKKEQFRPSPPPAPDIDSKLKWSQQRLYFEQELLLSDRSTLREPFHSALRKIARRGREDYRVPKGVFICYAQPDMRNKNEQHLKWILPFLRGLYQHLYLAGLESVQLDIMNYAPGNNIHEYMRGAETSDFVLLIGTESLIREHESGIGAVSIELSHIRRKRTTDTKARMYRVFPILISGNDSVFPIEYHDYSTIKEWGKKTYFTHLHQLIAALYSTNEEAFRDIWEEFLKIVGEDTKLLLLEGLPEEIVSREVKEDKKYQEKQYQTELRGLKFDHLLPLTSSLLLTSPKKEEKTISRFAIGDSNFKAVQERGDLIIDKSLLIKDIIDDKAQVKLITRPRRFGKTFNMSMLRCFFEKTTISRAPLFHPLKIWQEGERYQREQGQYPVLFVTFKDIKASRYEEAYEEFQLLISDLYRAHKNFLFLSTLKEDKEGQEQYQNIIDRKADKTLTRTALASLMRYLRKSHSKRVIILIDEYDTPIHASYSGGYYGEMANFMRGFLSPALKDNSDLYHAILTGILRVAKESIFSGLNNICVYSVLSDKYSAYFGFSDAEVRQLLGSEMTDGLFDKLKQWYGGYLIGDHHIFNPWSVVSFIEDNRKQVTKRKQFKGHWVHTSENELVENLLNKKVDEVKLPFRDLLEGKSFPQKINEHTVFADIDKDTNALWSFLLLTGYLSHGPVDHDKDGGPVYNLIIPNRDLYLFYEEHVKKWFKVPTSTSQIVASLGSPSMLSKTPTLIEDWGSPQDSHWSSYHLYKKSTAIKIQLEHHHVACLKDPYKVLYQALSLCDQHVQYLDLSENALDDLSALSVAQFLQESHHELHTLRLSHNHITAEGLEFILKALVRKPSIQFLFFDNNYIDFERYFCEKILETSVEKAGLKHLDLSMNFIHEDETFQEVGLGGRLIKTVPDKADTKRENYCREIFKQASSAIKSYPAKSSQLVRSILEPRERLDESSGIISLFAFKTALPPFREHAFLAVEGIHDFGQRFIIMGDIFATDEGVMISVAYCSPQEYLDRTGNRERVWSRSVCKPKADIEKLISVMLESRAKQNIHRYQLLPSFEESTNNCLKWAIGVLKKVRAERGGSMPSWDITKEWGSSRSCIIA